MFPSRLPIDNNQETVPLSPRPFIKTGLAAEESDSSIYIRGANMKRYRLFQNIGLLTAMSFALVSCFKDELVGSRVNSRSNIIGFGISAATTADGAPLTRATQYADSALLMLGRGGADTLYLHASSENNISALVGHFRGDTRRPCQQQQFQHCLQEFFRERIHAYRTPLYEKCQSGQSRERHLVLR